MQTNLNLLLAWLWILLGFASGFALGTRFHDENWLGGYTSHKRRLYRLCHISFFGLALINLMFYFTVRGQPLPAAPLGVASWGFVAGAVSMPVCCVIMAHRPRWRALFLIPVLSLITAGTITLWEVALADGHAARTITNAPSQPAATPSSPSPHDKGVGRGSGRGALSWVNHTTTTI